MNHKKFEHHQENLEELNAGNNLNQVEPEEEVSTEQDGETLHSKADWKEIINTTHTSTINFINMLDNFSKSCVR